MFELIDSLLPRDPTPPPNNGPPSTRNPSVRNRSQRQNSQRRTSVFNNPVVDAVLPQRKTSVNPFRLRSIRFSGSKIFTGSTNLDTQSLSLDQAVGFMQLVPVAMCILDMSANVKDSNQYFKEHINSEVFTNGTGMSKRIVSILEIISLEDTDRFFSTLATLKASSTPIMQGDFLTKAKSKNKPVSKVYQWTLAMSPDRSYILATGKPVSSDGVAENGDEQVENALEKESESKDRSGGAFAASGTWTKFMDRVEENARKMVELKESQLKAQALAETLETKRIFVRHVSHEIRTPLNVVMSGLEFMESFKDILGSELLETLGDIRNACGVAIDILNDLLTYEKLDSNILTLDKSPCDFIDLVRRVCSMFQIQARYSNINLAFDNAVKSDRLTVDADSTKLSQVIRNLVSNALKFTPDGGMITVKLFTVADGKVVRLEVQDTGPGMTKEQRKKLFNEVVQFNPKELQNGQGSGLGLYLSRKIVDMHRGLIGVDVEWEGKGSIFFLELDVSDKAHASDDGTLYFHIIVSQFILCV